MALFGGKKNCPNCGQPQEKNWDKCPFCAQMAGMSGGMGGAMGPQGQMMGGPGMGPGAMGPGGMGAAMGGAPGMAPPPAFAGGGYGAGAPSGATQFGGGGGGGFGPPPGAPPPAFGGPPPGASANKTVMFGVGAGPAGALQLLGWLVPLKGPHRGELITLKPQQTVVGKDPTCDVVLNDSFLSSRHATIRAQGGTFVIEDHSTNGTFVNDKKVQRHELVDSDIVKLGQTLVKFKQL